MNILLIGEQATGKTTLADLFEKILSEANPASKSAVLHSDITPKNAHEFLGGVIAPTANHSIYCWNSILKVPDFIANEMDLVMVLPRPMSERGFETFKKLS